MGETKPAPTAADHSNRKSNLEEFEAGKLFHMEQVPGFLCDACGEIWFRNQSKRVREND